MYHQFYGFEGRPFELTSDPQFYFESASHTKALSYLGFGLDQREGVIVITGDDGCGKSTLAYRLLDRFAANELAVAEVGALSLSAENAVTLVTQAFGVESLRDDTGGDWGLLETFLQNESREGRRCLLIVDGCEDLTRAGFVRLCQLSELRLGTQTLLQCVLLGRAGFLDGLPPESEAQRLQQKVVASYELEALDADETRSFVYERLRRVGWDGHPAMEDEMLHSLVAHARGSMRRINQMMNRLLLVGAIEESEALTAEMLNAVIKEMKMDTQVHEDGTGAVPILDAGPEDPRAKQRVAGAELETALAALQEVGKPVRPANNGPIAHHTYDELAAAIANVERRLEEQEQSLRHVLTMLIEWLEEEDTHEAA
ncbi:ExeA family protein [Erythrobacter ani]|uniref:AAA family ATPase n=1 Tax=Erythrobacter ani TaxID=2827235 RepID=A0ABS6SPI7_9SPHN|nr:AAA family ATPase [Erythrobacter ani]MBV7266945.1 AAA family ATPase [Erythrobacter ani]